MNGKENERGGRGGRRVMDGRDTDVRRGENEEQGGFELSREEERSDGRREVGEEERD